MQHTDYTIQLLPHDRLIPAIPGKSLMESLMKESIFLRSDCGGKGICGKCRVTQTQQNGDTRDVNACSLTVSGDITIKIPDSSLLSSHIISKPPVTLPDSFKQAFKPNRHGGLKGFAADLGTTTIAIYLCDKQTGDVIVSISIKNPQSLYGDDVMSRIGAINGQEKNLKHLQGLVVKSIEWGMNKLMKSSGTKPAEISDMVVVGNPTMIHILTGVDPAPIGVYPYQPAFYKTQSYPSGDLGFFLSDISLRILPQVSGFIGGDILGASLAVDLETQPTGTLLIDLSTNGELMLKGKNRLYATSCATGPAFEGASLSCGMQAIPGAIDKVTLTDNLDFPECSVIHTESSPDIKPSGICGSGVISAVSQLIRKKILEPGGAFKKELNQLALKHDETGKMYYQLVPEDNAQSGKPIYISQKDIRSVQLGKSALFTGIDFLLREAGLKTPEKIIIAGAFGSFLNKHDMITLGMIPDIAPERIEIAGNSAGAGAIMVLCDQTALDKSKLMANSLTVIDLASNQDFQNLFVQNLSFPLLK